MYRKTSLNCKFEVESGGEESPTAHSRLKHGVEATSKRSCHSDASNAGEAALAVVYSIHFKSLCDNDKEAGKFPPVSCHE